jgi:predicted ATP-grasp superfamily ATP-dependent carboligase
MMLKNYVEAIKKIDEPIAFILGRYITSDLGTLRSLSSKNIPTVVLNPYKKQISSFSKYYRGITCPNPKQNEDPYVNFLIDIGKNLNAKGVLIPNGDAEVHTILKNKNRLEKYYLFTSSDYKTTEKLLNKKLFYKLVDKLEIPYPKTHFIDDESNILKISKKTTYPCILKPIHSDYFKTDFKTRLFFIKNKEELVKKYKISTTKNHKVMVQEIIPGGSENNHGFNAYFDRKQNIFGSFMYRRIRDWPLMFGPGCLIESTNAPELKELTSFICNKIKYRGIVDAEFKKDPRDNKFKIIEINPRNWMQNSLPARCGINLPYVAYCDAIGKNFEKPKFNGKHIKWLFFQNDFLSSMKLFRGKEMFLSEWIKSYKGKKEHAIFSKHDPLPAFVLYIREFFKILHMYKK